MTLSPLGLSLRWSPCLEDEDYNKGTCLRHLLGRLIGIMYINTQHIKVICYMALVRIKFILDILLLGTILIMNVNTLYVAFKDHHILI